MSERFILLIFIISIIILIVRCTQKKHTRENYYETSTYELVQNKNGKLLVKDKISIEIGDKNILLPNVEIDTGSSNLVLDYNSTKKLLNNNDSSKLWCSKGGWGESCNPYSHTSNFSGKKITSNFYKGKVSFLNSNNEYDVTMGNGSANKNIKDYTILGFTHNKDEKKFNYLGQLFQNENIPKNFTFRFNNLKNGEGGSFSFNETILPDITYIDYIPNNKNKYILKILSIDIDGRKINLKNPYASIDSGSENFTLPTKVWDEIGGPSYGKVSVKLSDDKGNVYTLTNNTPIRNYDPGTIKLNNYKHTPYLLIGKFLMQNHEIIFDIDNKKIGFSQI